MAAAAADFMDVYDDEVDAREEDNFPAFIDGIDDQTSLGPFAVSRKATVLEALAEAKVGPSDTVLDIGSGDGRFCVAAVQRYGARAALGVELDEDLCQLAASLAGRCGVADRCAFVPADFTKLSMAQLAKLVPGSSSNRSGSADLADSAAAAAALQIEPAPSTQAAAPGPAAAETSAAPPAPLALPPFSVVVVYLLPESEARFKEVLTQLYEAGTRIVAIHFPLSPALGLRQACQGRNFRLYCKE